MSDFTRVTVIGSTRRATLVLPSDEPVAVLLPDIADLLAEPPVPEGHLLVTSLGEETRSDSSLDEQGIVSGCVLRIVNVSAAPAPPEVSDITDAVASRTDSAPAGWNSTHRATLTGVALGALTLLLTNGASSPPWLPVALLILFALLAAALGWTVSLRAGLTAAAVALGAIPAAAMLIIGALPTATPPSLIWPIGAGLASIVLGAAGSKRSALGGAVGLVLATITVVMPLCGVPLTGTAAVIAVAATAALGLLPSLALTLSGVTLLDDQVLAGSTAPRSTVMHRIADAYGMFSWAIVALAGFAAFALAVLLTSADVFAVLLGVALLLVLALRTRVMPLAVQSWALWAAVLIGIWAAVATPRLWPTWSVPVICVAGGLLITLLGLLRPRPHLRVRARRFGDFVEGLAAITMIPLALGVFGVYAQLLQVFS